MAWRALQPRTLVRDEIVDGELPRSLHWAKLPAQSRIQRCAEHAGWWLYTDPARCAGHHTLLRTDLRVNDIDRRLITVEPNDLHPGMCSGDDLGVRAVKMPVDQQPALDASKMLVIHLGSAYVSGRSPPDPSRGKVSIDHCDSRGSHGTGGYQPSGSDALRYVASVIGSPVPPRDDIGGVAAVDRDGSPTDERTLVAPFEEGSSGDVPDTRTHLIGAIGLRAYSRMDIGGDFAFDGISSMS